MGGSGLVDLQVNGFGGFDLKGDDLSVEVVVGLRGVVGEARRRYAEVREAIPFVHLEGPRISDQDGPRGCHDAAFVRPPDIKEFERCQRDGLIGHTHADTAQIRAAVDAGARLSTHLGHGAHAQLPRHPNYLWAQLADDRLTAGFIADRTSPAGRDVRGDGSGERAGPILPGFRFGGRRRKAARVLRVGRRR